MLFNYKVITPEGVEKTGQIEANNLDNAQTSLQQRGFIIESVTAQGEKSFFAKNISWFSGVSEKSVVIMSRQMAALFDAQVSALKAFTLMAENTDDKTLRFALQSVASDIQGGVSISRAMEKFPDVFSAFYVNMVRAGEESGKLTETFQYLADYLDRQHELTSKTKNALIYPGFVIATFIAVMVLMFTFLIPKLSVILIETGQQLPFYTRVVIWMSDLFVNYGIFVLIALIIVIVFFVQSLRTDTGKKRLDNWKISAPILGKLYQKLYLSRIADNLDTMLSSGIPVLRALEITGDVVDNRVYRDIMQIAVTDVKSGVAISSSMEKSGHIPTVMISMIRIGEETGTLAPILKKMAKFYKQEVDGAVDTLISLIEPVMIVALGVGVGLLLTSILIPIYNLTSNL